MPGSPRHHYEPRRSPSRQRQPQTKQGHAARPADERLLTDVQVPPLAPHIRRTSASTADRIGGLQLMSKAIVSNHESGKNLTLGTLVKWREKVELSRSE
jgi:hypothetical protein